MFSHKAILKVSVLLTGYPAPRRCHSCVQIRNGEQLCNQHHLIKVLLLLFRHHPDIWYHIRVCVNVLVVQQCLSYFFSVVDVFICGGYNGELILSDLWKINLQTFEWSKLPAVMPEPAYFHCAAVTPVSTPVFSRRIHVQMMSRSLRGTRLLNPLHFDEVGYMLIQVMLAMKFL